MELLQLTYFCHAAETENFAKTARHFGIPAAGISQSIKRLENELGVSLFDRSPSSIRLNARGESFYLSTKSALSMLDDARKKARDEEVSGECRLLVMTCREVVGEAIRRFREKHKGVSFYLSYDITEDVDKYDLIVTDNVPFRQSYTTFTLLTDPILLAVSREHPFAARREVDITELRNERFITTSKESGLFSITRRLCVKGNFAPEIAVETDDPRYVVKCIDANMGIGLVPTLSWRDILPESIALIEVVGTKGAQKERPSMVLQNTKKYASKATRLFLDELKETAKEYTQK